VTRVWIDLSNSPHPLLFAPIVRALEASDADVVLTARDNAQTIELARERWGDRVAVIGGESPPGRTAKGRAIARRVLDLRDWARAQRPDVALSHNSYAQIVAARMLRLPIVTAMDFEHQPANHLAFRLAHRILLPEALRDAGVERQGARGAKVRWYDGLKEEIYLGDFEPDPGVAGAFGGGNGRALVVARTPPSRALYHQFGNDLFTDAITAVGRHPDVAAVVLTRHPEQKEAIRALGLPGVTVPDHAVDSRSLMQGADLVLGAGGTMTREAALLGVPTFSLFAGERPAVDRWLEQQGMLRRLERIDDLLPVQRRSDATDRLGALRRRGEELVARFVDVTLDAARG
jgi:predicted glycosyltransferase